MAQPSTASNNTTSNIIYIEGNIGAGKSTLLSALKERLIEEGKYDRYTILKEPVDEWRNVNGQDLLRDFYREPKRWSFLTNVHILNTLIERHLSIPHLPATTNNHHCFLERSGQATRFIFVPYAYQQGLLTAAEFQVFKDLWLLQENNFLVNASYNEVTIYLRTSPSTCFERIRQRGTTVETESSNFTLDWLQQLHLLHEQWLLPLKPIIIDGEQSLSEIVNNLLILFP